MQSLNPDTPDLQFHPGFVRRYEDFLPHPYSCLIGHTAPWTDPGKGYWPKYYQAMPFLLFQALRNQNHPGDVQYQHGENRCEQPQCSRKEFEAVLLLLTARSLVGAGLQ